MYITPFLLILQTHGKKGVCSLFQLSRNHKSVLDWFNERPFYNVHSSCPAEKKDDLSNQESIARQVYMNLSETIMLGSVDLAKMKKNATIDGLLFCSDANEQW